MIVIICWLEILGRDKNLANYFPRISAYAMSAQYIIHGIL